MPKGRFTGPGAHGGRVWAGRTDGAPTGVRRAGVGCGCGLAAGGGSFAGFAVVAALALGGGRGALGP